jgi:hypothetical protein
LFTASLQSLRIASEYRRSPCDEQVENTDARLHREIFEREMPLCLRNEGGSIWLRRLR